MKRRLPFVLVAAFTLASCTTVPSMPPRAATQEAAAQAMLENLRGDPGGLYAFLKAMPKGGDLHSHLSGAIYAESYLQWAAADGLCLEVAVLTVVQPPCDGGAGRPTVTAVQQNDTLRDQAIDAFSTRNYKPEVENGHERFFSTFGRFGAAGNNRMGDMLAEVANRAAEGRVRYLELMHTPAGGAIRNLGTQAGWSEDFAALRTRLLQAGVNGLLDNAMRQLDTDEARRDTLLGCAGTQPQPGCAVTTRYLYQVLRAVPREQVFAQILAGFELAGRDARFVGLNLVQPEDSRLSMDDYSLHMRIIGFLRPLYPAVKVSLHAGELAPELVPPEGLRFHIREAVDVAGAERIGHGVDLPYEDGHEALLARMAQREVMVEINLTSNAVILGVAGARHPLHTYLAHGVPVALSTDDEGVARSELTQEYFRAVDDQRLDYATLKTMTRNSLHYAFVEGASLWANYAALAPVNPCTPAAGGFSGSACANFAAANTKAGLQRALELDLAEFERQVASGGRPN